LACAADAVIADGYLLIFVNHYAERHECGVSDSTMFQLTVTENKPKQLSGTEIESSSEQITKIKHWNRNYNNHVL